MRKTYFSQLVLASGVAGVFFASACRERSRDYGPDDPCQDDATCPVTVLNPGNASGSGTTDTSVSVGAESSGAINTISVGAESSGGSTQGGESTDGTRGPVDTGTLAVGEACDENEQCALGFCVDGVCCQTACTEVCARCDVPGLEGTCSAVDDDDVCGGLSCPPDTECRSFVPPEGANCVALGECKLDVTCIEVASESGTSCQDGEGTCEGGQCVVPDKLVLGDPCAQADECGSGICVPSSDGVERCCELACDGLCEVCSVDGRCDAVPADDSECPVVSCSPDTSCTTYPDDLTSDRCAALGRCESEATHCAPKNEPSGESCGSGLACNGSGSCVSVCSASQLWCGSCVNPLSDNSHCGDCGEACGAGLYCNDGSCELNCGSGQVACNGRCANPQTDMQYCGVNNSCAGGDSCSSPEVCSNGVCTLVCSGGTINCNNTCVDPNTDNTFCGAAGNCVANNGEVCGNGYACNSGVCRQQCPSGRVSCGGTCIDPATNNNNCGASGFCEAAQAGDRCTGGEQCVGGSCRLPTGSTCTMNSQCASNSCLTFYRDVDGDGFGALSSGTARFCTSSPSTEYVVSNTDCCDIADDMALAKEANTSYTGGFRDYGAVGCAEPFDWNCSKSLSKSTSVNKACPAFTTEATCPGVTFQNDPACGVPSNATACGWDGAVCTNARGAQWTQTCY